MHLLEHFILRLLDRQFRKIKSEFTFTLVVSGIPALLTAIFLFQLIEQHQWREYFGAVVSVFLGFLSCARAVRMAARYRAQRAKACKGHLPFDAMVEVGAVYLGASLIAAVSIIVVLFLFRMFIGRPI